MRIIMEKVKKAPAWGTDDDKIFRDYLKNNKED